jgi:hypothetical protein
MVIEKTPAGNSTYPKGGVQCSADTFVVKIATFAKPETVSSNNITTVVK